MEEMEDRDWLAIQTAANRGITTDRADRLFLERSLCKLGLSRYEAHQMNNSTMREVCIMLMAATAYAPGVLGSEPQGAA